MGFSSQSGGGGGFGTMSDINVTPLVDVMLVLLIIFMITAPMLTQGVDVELPASADAETLPSNESPLTLTVTKDERVFLGTTEIPADRIVDVLSNNARLQAEKELYLHADQSIPYGVVVRVMAAAKRGGAESLAMITDPVGTSPRRKKDGASKGKSKRSGKAKGKKAKGKKAGK